MIEYTKKFTNIDEYIAMFPDDVQIKLQELRKVIKEIAPDASEAISYQMPTFKLAGRNLIHFAAYKHHIGLYPASSGVSEFKNELASYKTSRGAIQFPIDKPIPFDLVRRITKFRVAENIAYIKTTSY